MIAQVVLITAMAFLAGIGLGGMAVALWGWSRTHDAAHRLLDLLDTVSEEERLLRNKIEDLNNREGRVHDDVV